MSSHKSLFIFLIMILLFPPMSANAQSQYTFSRDVIGQGYTDEGIYYEVYSITPNITNCSMYMPSKYISVKYVYYGTITPESKKIYTETLDNITYSGTLNLLKYEWKEQKTYAYYEGYVYPQY